MTRNKLKSTLDLSFADVNFSQAKLLLLNAQDNVDSTMASLDSILGLTSGSYMTWLTSMTFECAAAGCRAANAITLQQRPDLQALNLRQQSAVKFSHAERDQMLPSISAAGTVGSVPIRPAQYYTSNWWGGIGVNIDIPIFNGFLYSAQAKGAANPAPRRPQNKAGISAIGLSAMCVQRGSPQIPHISALL